MSWFVLLILSVIAFGTHAKPASTIQPRIIDGNDTRIENYPYMVAVLHNNQFLCGGSLISSSIVLTAAHCTQSKPSTLSVRVGSTSAQSGGQIIQVRKLCVHPKYSENTNDVSVLQLERPVSISNSVGIIQLQPEGIVVPDGAEAVITGWGITESGLPAKVLQSLTVNKVPQDRCVTLMKPNLITSSMTCYSKPGVNAGACFGDSGGPLVVNGKQVGITSWSRLFCGNPEYPVIFTNIEEKSINQHIQKCVKEFS